MAARDNHASVVSDSLREPGQFYGEITSRHAWSNLLLSELRYQSASKLPTHSHELAFFTLVLRGDYEEFSGGRCGIIQRKVSYFAAASA